MLRHVVNDQYRFDDCSRFVDRDWFIQKEQERRDYLELLGRALNASDWRCLSYALMSNHIHLAMVAGADALDVWLRRVHSPFADLMNRAYGRIGPMFVRGPKSLLVPASGVGSDPRRRSSTVWCARHDSTVVLLAREIVGRRSCARGRAVEAA